MWSGGSTYAWTRCPADVGREHVRKRIKGANPLVQGSSNNACYHVLLRVPRARVHEVAAPHEEVTQL